MRQAIIDYIRDIKSKARCADCRHRFPYYVMEFDHVRGEKLFGIANSYKSKTMGQVIAEVEKCDVVCSNCHKIRTWTRLMEELDAIDK